MKKFTVVALSIVALFVGAAVGVIVELKRIARYVVLEK